MENEIRLVFLVIGAAVLLGIYWDGLRRQRRARQRAGKPASVQEQQREVLREALDLSAEQQVQAAEIVDEVVEQGKSNSLTELEYATKAAGEPVKSEWYQEVREETFQEVEVESEGDYPAEVCESHIETMDENDAPAEIETTLPPADDSVQTEQQTSHDELIVESVDVEHPEKPADIAANVEMDESADVQIEQVSKPALAQQPSSSVEPPRQTADQYIMFTVVAPGEKLLGGFSLLQGLLNCGFRFGENNIFHYHLDNNPEKPCLFSLAAATETGEFELSDMANFSCKGVVLFMNGAEHEAPDEVFSDMVEAAESLANILHAELRIGQNEVWDEEKLQSMHDRLLQSA